MSTVIMSVGVTKSNTVHSPSCGSVATKRRYQGSNVVMLPLVFPQGKDLEAKRREAHRLIDECIDVFKKDQEK
jgi:hypothetical protein